MNSLFQRHQDLIPELCKLLNANAKMHIQPMCQDLMARVDDFLKRAKI